MPLSSQQIEKAAQNLFDAEKSKKKIGLLSIEYENIDMEDAYKIQDSLVQMKIQSGLTIQGWKIGLTSKAMQDALKIDIPDSGILFDNMFFKSGESIPTDRFIETRIEAEIAFCVNKTLEGHVSREDVIAATEYVFPSLEILDTRIDRKDSTTGKLRTVYDTISDNAANAGVVSGIQKNKLEQFDLRYVGSIVYRNGMVEETGLGAGVLDDPVAGIVWLVQRLAKYNQKISPGEIILSGSFIRPIEAKKGDKFYADFGKFGFVECDFK